MRASSDSARSIRILVVDDHDLLRQGLVLLLGRFPGVQAVDEAECCADALAKSEADPPDLLIMDVHLPEINGVETTRRILARHPGVKVIMLSGDTSAPVILAALRAGAAAYLSKQNPSEEVLRATW